MFFAKLLIFTGTVVAQFFLALLATSAAGITSYKITGYIIEAKLTLCQMMLQNNYNISKLLSTVKLCYNVFLRTKKSVHYRRGTL